MPRSGWLAVGATIVALTMGADLGPRATIMVVVGVVGLGILAAWLEPSRRRVAMAVAVGAAAITLRVVVGPSAPSLQGVPEGRGPWTMRVETVGSPRDGQQVARFEFQGPEPTSARP